MKVYLVYGDDQYGEQCVVAILSTEDKAIEVLAELNSDEEEIGISYWIMEWQVDSLPPERTILNHQ